MFDIIILEIDSNTSSMPLSLIIVSAFEFEQKVLYKVFSSLCVFSNFKTSAVTNLKSDNSENKSIRFFFDCRFNIFNL